MHWSFKRLLSRVGPLMLLQGTCSWKTLVTPCALEWLLYCASHVSPNNFMLKSLWKASIHFVHLNGISPEWDPYVPSSGQLLRSCWHTLGIKKASLLCGSSHVSSSCMLEGMPYYNWSIWIGFLLFGSSHESKWPNFEKFLVHVLHLNVFFLTEGSFWMLSF